MSEWYSDYVDGITECPHCKRKKLIIETTNYVPLTIEKDGTITAGAEFEEQDVKVTCAYCEKEVEQ